MNDTILLERFVQQGLPGGILPLDPQDSFHFFDLAVQHLASGRRAVKAMSALVERQRIGESAETGHPVSDQLGNAGALRLGELLIAISEDIGLFARFVFIVAGAHDLLLCLALLGGIGTEVASLEKRLNNAESIV
jgi:hypothetical protein